MIDRFILLTIIHTHTYIIMHIIHLLYTLIYVCVGMTVYFTPQFSINTQISYVVDVI